MSWERVRPPRGGEKRQEVLEPVLMRKEQAAHCWGIRADREERFGSRDAPGCPRDSVSKPGLPPSSNKRVLRG